MQTNTTGSDYAQPQHALPSWRDVITLLKPRITIMAGIMAGGGFLLASKPFDAWQLVWGLIGTMLAVGAANALNMYIERESDLWMERTRDRPLPAGRMAPSVALVTGLLVEALSTVVLLLWVNTLTAVLGLLAFVLYVGVYTPMKRRSPMALFVGAIPGAMPSLMGWSAAMGSVDAVGLAYTAILFFWQLPHFLAIAMYRKEEYANAKIRAVPVVHGEAQATLQLVLFTAALVVVSLLLVPLGAASWFYALTALMLGGWFTWLGVEGLRKGPSVPWAKRFFLASLVYLPALSLCLVVDIWLL